MDKTTLDQLAARAHKAQVRLRRVRNKRGDARAGIMGAVAKLVDAELERIYGRTMQYAYEDLIEAEAAHTRASEEYALTGAGAPAPLGTIYKEWLKGGRYWEGERPYTLTGRQAHLEAITSTSEHPKNTTRHAEVGKFVLRLFKKDGTLSLQYIPLVADREGKLSAPMGWHATGTNPNAAQPTK